MANPITETNAKYVSKLNMQGTVYTIQDEWARAEITEIETVIKGGVHFRGVLTEDSITDGEALKVLTVKDGEGTKTIAIADQADGDLFIYPKNGTNLEFVVSNNAYSELGSTGTLKALAFADNAAGSVEVPLAASITADQLDRVTGIGTVAVTYETGSLSTSEAATAADIGLTAAAANVTYSEAAASFDTETANAGIGSTATAATLGVTTADAGIGTTETAAGVTYANTAASVTYAPTNVTAAGPSVSLTNTKGTFTALSNVTYDRYTMTLSISNSTSDEFIESVSVSEVGSISVTYDKVSDVTYAKVSGVTYDKATTVTYVKATGVTYEKATSVTYDKVSAVTYAKTSAVTYDKTTAVTYDKVSASGTFLTSASLNGTLATTNTAPTLTITNPTITVTVSPVSA